MKNRRKKVMVLDNISSPYISEAIIFLKDYDPVLDTRAVREAEKIVNDYLKRTAPVKEKESGVLRRLFKYSIILMAMCLCFVTGYFLK